MVRFVTILESVQDLDGFADRRLLDLNRLESAFQGRILLQVLAILLEGGGTDRLQFASREHRLQDRRGINGAFGGTCTHKGVDFIDEEDDVAAALDLLQDLLETLLEVSPITGARHKSTKIECVEILTLEVLRDVLGHDFLGEPFNDRGLAHSGLSDEHRVVLGATGQDLHYPFDLALTAYDRVELGITRHLGEVPSELVENRRPGRP